MPCDDHSFHVKVLESTESFLICVHLWLCIVSYDWSNSMPIWLCCNDVIHSVHKELTL